MVVGLVSRDSSLVRCVLHNYRDVVMMDDLRPGSVVQRTPGNAETGEGYSADIAFTTDGSILHLVCLQLAV